MLTPAEFNRMQQDHDALITGRTGAEVILHYNTSAGAVDIMGRSATETEVTGAARAFIITSNPRQVQAERTTDIQQADAVFCFLTSVDLDREGLWFEVPGLGDFTPEAKPVGAPLTAPLFVNGVQLVQMVETRKKR